MKTKRLAGTRKDGVLLPDTTNVIDTAAGALDAATDAMGLPMQYLICAAWFAGFFAASRVFRRWIGPRLGALAKRMERPYVAAVLHGFLRPVTAFIAMIGLYIGVRLLPFAFLDTPGWQSAMTHIVRITVVILGAWGGLATFSCIFQALDDTVAHTLGATASRFLERICKVVIVLIALVLIVNDLGFNVNSLITGLGLGGLTVALAAQDTAANFFGGLVILFEKPFGIGDWISTASVEGTVEDITFRSTKVRTLGNALTLVPNSKICADPITNWSRLKMRLANFTISLVYSTPRTTVQAVLDDLRAMLRLHPDVIEDTIQVRLLDFAASSLDVFVFFYVNTTSIVEYRAVREDVNLRIIDIMERHGASFAFPSQTVYVERTPGEKGAPSPERTDDLPPLWRAETRPEETPADAPPADAAPLDGDGLTPLEWDDEALFCEDDAAEQTDSAAPAVPGVGVDALVDGAMPLGWGEETENERRPDAPRRARKRKGGPM